MLEYNEIKPKKFVVHEGEPWEVLTSHVFRKQQRKPVNAAKLRNLITGRTLEISFGANDKAEEADLGKREIKYLYKNDKKKPEEYWFADPENPKDRYMIDANVIGDQIKFMKDNTMVTALVFDEKIISIIMPIKVELKITETPPNIKGATASQGNKPLTLETGAVISGPMFLSAGDVIIVNTETKEYVSKA